MEKNITWNSGSLSMADRERVMGQKPLVLWFTGLSGSGKSTVANGVEKRLSEQGFKTLLLDGDNLRHGLNSNLGFSDADREENIRRIAEAAALAARSCVMVLVAAISPGIEMRRRAREIISQVCPFVEIYVSADVETCAGRDPKGLYKKAFAGEIRGFTGVDSPYERPESPEITLDTKNSPVEDCVVRVAGYALDLQLDRREMLEKLRGTARRAGNAIMEIYAESDLGVEYKDDRSPLTAADKASNELICAELSRFYPEYSVLTEESADDRRRLRERYCFIVDPLDGTKEFIKRNGEFTVNIALVFDGSPILGVIYVPADGSTYFAAKGVGAFRERGGAVERINVSRRRENLVAMDSRSHTDSRSDELFERNKAKIAEKISAGSSLKGCRIAEGAADVYYRFGFTCEWDTAAMQCICECAGATVMQCDDTPLTYNRPDTLNEKGFYIINDPANRLHEKYEFHANRSHMR